MQQNSNLLTATDKKKILEFVQRSPQINLVASLFVTFHILFRQDNHFSFSSLLSSTCYSPQNEANKRKIWCEDEIQWLICQILS